MQNIYYREIIFQIIWRICGLCVQSPARYFERLGRVAQSVQRLATVWTVRVSNPGKGEIFRTCPERPQGPPSLMYKGYRLFPEDKKRPGHDADHSPPSTAVVIKGQSYTSTPPMDCTACTEPQCLYKGAPYLIYYLPKVPCCNYSQVYYSLLQTAGFQNIFPQYPVAYLFLFFPFQLHAQHILATYLSIFIVQCLDPFNTINRYIHVGNVCLPQAAVKPLDVWFFQYISGPQLLSCLPVCWSCLL